MDCPDTQFIVRVIQDELPYRMQLCTLEEFVFELNYPQFMPLYGDKIERYGDAHFIIKQVAYQIYFIDHTQRYPLIFLRELNTISYERFIPKNYLSMPKRPRS